MLRTIIYARVSTEDQAEKYGLPAQLRACREHAASRAPEALEIFEEILDEGITGTTMERPGLERLRKLVREGAVDVVLMLDPDRLSRELIHLLILKPEIEKRARLEFVTATFDNSPSGELFFNLKGAIAKYERAVTRDRCMRGQKEQALAGRVHGGRIAYGYRRLEGGLLALDETRAPYVRSIFAWFDAGISIRAIAKRLRQDGVPTWSGRQWAHSSVRRILTNETYAGVSYFGTYRSDGGRVVLRVPQNRISLSVPGLVDRELWERVQARLRANPHTGGRPSTRYLLQGLLYCGACGRRMGAERHQRGGHSYRCYGRDPMRHHGDPCRVTVAANRVDDAAWREIVAVFSDVDFLRAMLVEREEQLRAADDPGRVETWKAQARKLKAREDLAVAALLDPDFAADRLVIRKRYQEAQRERLRIEAEIATVERAAAARGSARGWMEETVELLRDYIATLTSAEERQRFVRGILRRAEWDGKELKMSCFIGPKPGTSAGCCDPFAALEVLLTARLAA